MMTRPLILFIIDGLAGGGAEKTVITLAEKLAELYADVAIISLRKAKAYSVHDSVRLITIEDSYTGPFHRLTEIKRRAIQLDLILEKHFSGREISLAISNLPKTDRIVAASRTLKNAWMCLHGAVASTQLENKTGIRRWIKKRQLKNTYNNRKLITVSDGLQKDITEIGQVRPDRIITIHNPFNISEIQKASRQDCQISNERYIAHMGRFHFIKRHDRLFEAFKRSNYRGKLALIGSGKEEEIARLKALCRNLDIENRVLFCGFQHNPYPYLKHAEALVLSSDSEGFGNVIVEALICDTPVVSTDCPYGPRDILTGELSRGLSKLNPEDLAKTLNSILYDTPKIKSEHIEKYDINHIAQKYMSLLEI